MDQNLPLFMDSLVLDSEELSLVQNKYMKTRLIFAVTLKFFQLTGRFPNDADIISTEIVSDLANQLQIPLHFVSDDIDWGNRSYKRFHQEIRHFLGFKRPTLNDSKPLISWLMQHIVPQSLTLDQCRAHAYRFLQENKIEAFSKRQLNRFINAAHHRFERQFFERVTGQLSDETKKSLDQLVGLNSSDGDEKHEIAGKISLNDLKKDIAGLKLNLVKHEIKKLAHLTAIELPKNFLFGENRKLLKKYYARILAESPSNLEEYHPNAKYAALAIFCHVRSQLMIDGLADFTLQLMHRVTSRAEKQTDNYILSEVKRVGGKFDILLSLANTAIEKPTGIIQEEIYPKIDQVTLQAVVNDLKHRGSRWYKNQVQTKMLSLYSHNNRRIFLVLLGTLSLHASHSDYGPLLKAIHFILNNQEVTDRYYANSDAVPLSGVISNQWSHMVLEQQEPTVDGKNRPSQVNRMNYEVALLEALCTQIRCKNIWIEGAYRYRDPDEDLPKDFNDKLQYYFSLLGLPIDPDQFIEPLKKDLDRYLCLLDKDMPHNSKVKIVQNKKGWRISLSPSEPQTEPRNIQALHREIANRWATIPLIDVFKEADLRIGFTGQFHSVTSRESLDKAVLQKRLLLCLYAIGSNTGLKRISAGHGEETYSDLRYVKRRYIQCQQVRNAIADVVNGILEIRDPATWGEDTTGCACDSKHISSWDQNLITSWHARYRKKGVMVYWHVDKKSACIHSQLKTCTSSEVGAMMMGFLNHDTKMDMNEIYVDTHGQSTIGFGFSRLLHFDLLPRLKNINTQKLSVPSATHKKNYKNLEHILTSPIRWEIIRENYRELVRYAAALKSGTVEADVMIKRLSKDNYNHPIYQALLELGKAIKTIFLCRYLSSEELRIEIHEALNVVERLNSIMSFISYGKLGEISTNNADDLELSILCLHLIQVCMVYMNTLMIQEVLKHPHWKNRLTVEDKRALTPLIHAHLNPYGLFPLDMNTRIQIVLPDQKRQKYKVAAYV